jgi:uncharacterized protein (PEP-CTERM system associated)
MVAIAFNVRAQSALEPSATSGARIALTIEPRISATETFTSNGQLSGSNPKSEQITEISPGIHISSNGGRVRGYLDYSLSGVAYAQDSSANGHSQSLNAAATVVAIENRAFLDVSGVISRQAVSAFGTQSVGSALANANSNLSETSSYRLSPYVHGQVGDAANYEARYSLMSSRTDSSAASDVTTKDWSLRLGGGSSFSRLAWSVEATRQNADYDAGRDTEADLFRASLTYAFMPQFSLTAIGLSESNNYTALTKETHHSGGWGANWSPSDRTKLSFVRENRFFGESHSLSFEHRTGRTVWRFSDSKDVSVAPNQATTASLGSIYDLFFSQFATVEPDPVKRSQIVNSFLQANGINSGATVTQSYLTSAVSLQRRQDLSVALLGVRDTITVLISRGEGSQLDTVLGVSNDFATSAVVRQVGLSVNYSHRLSPEASINLTGSQQNASGTSSDQDTTLRALLLNVSTSVGPRTTLTFGGRRVVFQSSTTPYNETAVTCSLLMRF